MPVRRFTPCGPTTTLPEVEVKTGIKLISFSGPPIESQGTHTLYDAPRSDVLKCCENCSAVNTNLRSGERVDTLLPESSYPYTTS